MKMLAVRRRPSVLPVFVVVHLLSVGCSPVGGLNERSSGTLSIKWVSCWNVCRCSGAGNASVVNCSRADIDSLPIIVDGRPGDARTLTADWNRISRLDVNFSAAFPYVEAISLEHNNISEISPGAFRGLRLLRRLSLNDNDIKTLPSTVFSDTAGLEDLSIGGNPMNIDSLGTALSRIDSDRLRRLDASRTSLGQFAPLPETVFGRLFALEHLVLREVTIENATADYFLALHSGLTTLDLTSSNIERVDERSFSSLSTTLTELILDNVIISTTDLENIFAGLADVGSASLSSLPSTNVDENNSTTMAATTSTPKEPRLETLAMNNVFADDGGVDSSVNVHMFRHLSHAKLKTLRFDRNYFGHHLGGRIPERLFHPLRHLTSLSLSYCDIRSIPSETFRGLRRLEVLNLRGNQLSCVRQSHCGFLTSSQSVFNHLTVLDMSDNVLESGTSVDDDSGVEDFTSSNSGDGGGGGLRFPDDIFPELVELDLSGNRLSSVYAGMFGKLRRLARLKLSDNIHLADIEPDSLLGLSGLVRLEIDGCRRLSHLKAGVLAGLVNLRVLSIRDSGLVHIHHAVLARLEHLEEIHLRNNRLGEQGGAINRLSAKSSNSIKLIDLSGNKLSSMPTVLLSRSSRLTALYLANNRIPDCSGLASIDWRQYSTHDLVIDLSDNIITEPTYDCTAAGRATLLYLGGNPLHCGSCVTAQFVASMMTSQYEGLIDDRARVTCVTPSNIAGEGAFDAAATSRLPGRWHCKIRDVTIVTALATLSLAVVVLAIALLRNRIATSGWPLGTKQRRCGGRSVLSTTGSVSSTVTISNGCYGNGSTGEVAASQPLSVIGGSDSMPRYSPLVEDDSGRREFQTSSSPNGHQFWPKRASSMSLSGTATAGDNHDETMATSSTADIKCPLIGNGSSADRRGSVDASNGGVGIQRNNRSTTAVSRGVRNGSDARLIDATGNSIGDVEDSL